MQPQHPPKYIFLRDALVAAKTEPTRENFMQLLWACGSALAQGNGLGRNELESCFDEVFTEKSNPDA
jgi:hypothetical protein